MFRLIPLFLVFLVLSGCSAGINGSTNPNFWEVHGFWFLVFMNLFPRITMLVATPYPIGLLGWLGWLFVPRIMAAILATHFYWDTNPVLCVITWLVAFGTTWFMLLGGGTTARRRQRK